MDTATKTETRCETVDKIVRWDEIVEGDLVLYEGKRELVTDFVTNPASMCVYFEGVPEPVRVRRELETAVTRYVESTEE